MLNSKFDSAMVAFLDCLKQIGDEIEKVDNKWFLPYKCVLLLYLLKQT